MPPAVTIKSNNVERLFRQITIGTTRALNRSMLTARTQAVRDIQAETGSRQAPIRKGLVIDRAKLGHLVATIHFRGKRLRLIDITPSRRPKVPGSFTATVRAPRTGKPHKGIFVRTIPSRPRKGLPRHSHGLPIQEKYLVSVPFVATKQRFLESTLRVAAAAFAKNHARDIRFATGGGV